MNRSPDQAAVLLEKARGDLAMLEHLARNPEMPNWGIGFHAQQAVEKAIKAVLAANSVEYPRTHNLVRLLQLLGSVFGPMPPDGMELKILTVFGVPLRYDQETPDQEISIDRAWAVGAARRCVAWAESRMRTMDQQERGQS